MMQIIKRDLFLCAAITAFVVLCAVVWGSPLVRTSSSSDAVFAQADQPQSTVFHGTVLRDGEQFFLRDNSGQVFHLDDAQFAKSFEGKSVTVTGHFASHPEAGGQLIHIERIEPAA